MKLKIYFLLTSTLISFSACSSPIIKDCADCSRKTVGAEVQPDKKTVLELKTAVEKPIALATKSPLVIISENSRAVADDKEHKREDLQGAYCMRYEMAQDNYDVKQIIKDGESSQFSGEVTSFWTTPACNAPTKTDTKVPILFNTVTDVYRSENFPKIVHDYFFKKLNNPEAWLKAINTLSTDGQTFLDFLKYSLDRGNFASKESTEAALRVTNYLCQNGGVYSKYKESSKCP
jgi:hypothetical protein